MFPGGKLPSGISLITKDDLTEGQVHFSQMLFSGPVIAGWRAAGAAVRAAYFAKMTARGEVVQQVATAYLHAIAASSEVDNAAALAAQGQVLLDHAHAAHQAGTVSNLEELRAKVQLQAQQQALLYAQNYLEKDLILLKREIGIDPGQKIVLTDPAPFSDLAEQSPEEVRAVSATTKLVQVARSNVELTTRALSDETDRVNAGVDDNLPLVTAQATLASAESNLVESLYQYNLSKLALARAAGVLETQYRAYLGR